MTQSNIIKIIDTKICKGCKAEKALGEFDKNSGNRGFRTMCKTCRHEEYRAARGSKSDGRKKQIVTETGRVCISCGEEKSWDKFHKDVHGFNQKTATCGACRNSNYVDPRSGSNKGRPDKIKRLYGVTYEHVVQTLNEQHGLCANRACGKEISLDVAMSSNRAVIDHCHTTGKFRAVLCQPCNMLLGSIETKQNLMLGLVEYLSKYRFLTKET